MTRRWIEAGLLCCLGTLLLTFPSPSLYLNMDWAVYKASAGYAGVYSLVWVFWIVCGVYTLSVYEVSEPMLFIRISRTRWWISVIGYSLIWAFICSLWAFLETGLTAFSAICRLTDLVVLALGIVLLLELKGNWKFAVVIAASIAVSLSLHTIIQTGLF